MAYKINGFECTEANGCLPSRHSVGPVGPAQTRDTIGGTIVLEPVSGQRRVHTWEYDSRRTNTVRLLREAMQLDFSPICIIDTYDVTKTSGGEAEQLTSLVVTAQFPEVKTDGSREWTESFSIQFTEMSPQS